MPSPSGAPTGLAWLDARSLVLNTMPQLGGQNQLFRLPYSRGPVTRITNDPNDYVGTSLSGDRRDLVTARREARMDVWSGDGAGGNGSMVALRVPNSIERLAWAGDQILYGAAIAGRPTILRAAPDKAASEEVVLDALTPGATSDGRTIVFVSSVGGQLDLWTADASGRRIAQLVPGVTAEQAVVTPDDRAVLYTSLVGGTLSIWTVPIAGGTPSKLVDGAAAAISPDGHTLAFVAMGSGQASISVCALPGCASPRPIGPAQFDMPIAWMPDGRGVAFPRDGNLWVQPLDGSGAAPAHAIHRHASDRIVCVVARRPASGDHAIDRDERHRPAQGFAGHVTTDPGGLPAVAHPCMPPRVSPHRQPRNIIPLLGPEPRGTAGQRVVTNMAGAERGRYGHVATAVAQDPFQKRLGPGCEPRTPPAARVPRRSARGA